LKLYAYRAIVNPLIKFQQKGHMKFRFLVPLMAALIMPLALTPVIVGCGGCSAVTEGQDAVVVRAEQVSRYAFEIFDTFVGEEERNRAAWQAISPEIEKAANKVRREGKTGLEELVKVTRIYKTNRTAENRTSLITWTAVVQDLVRIAEEHLALGRAATK